MMRSRALSLAIVVLPAAACAHGTGSHADQPLSRMARMDTGVVRRVCADADSVIAGRSACVLSDQGVRRRDVVAPH
jgi:hypothetical protein